jgi:hypothetical protein
MDLHTVYHEVAHAVVAAHYGAASDVLLRGSDAQRWRIAEAICGIRGREAYAYSSQARQLPWRERACIALAGPACDLVTRAPSLRAAMYTRNELDEGAAPPAG